MNYTSGVSFILKLAWLFGIVFSFSPCFSQGINISQIYGGGGNSGAFYVNDFVELFNDSPSPVDVTGWSVQYNAAATTGTWFVAPLPSHVMIQPYHYYLVQLGAGVSGVALPAPDATGTIAMSSTSGKVALCDSPTALTGADPTGSAVVVDFVGYGAANAFKGSGPATGAGNNTSLVRKGRGLINTHDNTNDFTTATPPTPRNSAVPANYPPSLTRPAFAAGQFTFTLSGTTGSNYVVQASTNLSDNNWISLLTNVAPFNYTHSVSILPQQFYRGMVAP